MAYVIGIDGGGTKTIVLFHKIESDYIQKQSEQTITGKGINPQLIGLDEMKNRLIYLISKGLNTFSIPPEAIIGICVGLAGVRVEKDKQLVKQTLQTIAVDLGFSKNIIMSAHSDVYIALRGALKPNETEGILIISGTGSNAIGVSKTGDVYSTGGWGHVLGDEGSGYYIGLRALNHVCKAYDLRAKPTVLTPMVLSHLDLENEDELIPNIYGTQPEKQVIAALTKLVVTASEQGDRVASQLLKEAADELANHIESLHQQCGTFNEQTPVTTAGSVFRHSRILNAHFIKTLEERKLGHYQEANSTPAAGAVIEAINALQHQSKKAGWLD